MTTMQNPPPAIANAPRAQKSLIEPRIRFFIGLFLVILAQTLFFDFNTPFLRLEFAQALNERFHLDFNNLENTLVGIVLLIIAAVLFWRSIPALAPHAAGGGIFARPVVLPTLFTRTVKHPRLLPFLARHWLSFLVAAGLFAFLNIQLTRITANDPAHALVLVWVAVIFLLVRVTFYYDQATGVHLSLNLNRWDILWMIGLFIFALVINSHLLDSVPNSIIGDEGNFWERARAISEGRERHSFFGVGTYTYPMPSNYFQGGILDIFGLSLWAWRFSSVLPAVLTVLPLYIFIREAFKSRWFAIIACVAMVTLPFFIAFGRSGYIISQCLVLVMLALYLLYSGIERQSMGYVALAAATAGLSFYTYTAGRLALVVGVIYFGLLFLARVGAYFRTPRADQPARGDVRGQMTRMVLFGTVFVVLTLITYIPNAVHTQYTDPGLVLHKTVESLFPNENYTLSIYTPEELYRDYPPIVIDDQRLFFRPDLYFDLLVRGTFRTLLGFHHLSSVAVNYIDGPLSGPVSVLFFFIGLLMSLRLFRQRNILFLLIWFYSGMILLSLINTFPARPNHMVPIIIPMAFFIGYGIVLCAEAAYRFLAPLFARGVAVVSAADGENALIPAPNRVTPDGRRWTLIAALALTGVVAVTGFRNFFIDMPDNYLPDFEQIMAFDAVDATRMEQMVYVSSVPERELWTPWVIEQIPVQVDYQNIPMQRLEAGELALQPGERYTFYYELPAQTIVEGYLQRALGEAITPTTHEDSNGRVLGMSYAFTAPRSNAALSSALGSGG